MGNNDISSRIKDIRKKIGLTQGETAEKLGFTVAQIKGWEGGKADPKTDYLFGLLKMSGFSGHWLLTGEEFQPEDVEISIKVVALKSGELKRVVPLDGGKPNKHGRQFFRLTSLDGTGGEREPGPLPRPEGGRPPDPRHVGPREDIHGEGEDEPD